MFPQPRRGRRFEPQQRRADPPDGQRALVNDRVQVARPHRRGQRRARLRPCAGNSATVIHFLPRFL